MLLFFFFLGLTYFRGRADSNWEDLFHQAVHLFSVSVSLNNSRYSRYLTGKLIDFFCVYPTPSEAKDQPCTLIALAAGRLVNRRQHALCGEENKWIWTQWLHTMTRATQTSFFPALCHCVITYICGNLNLPSMCTLFFCLVSCVSLFSVITHIHALHSFYSFQMHTVMHLHIYIPANTK